MPFRPAFLAFALAATLVSGPPALSHDHSVPAAGAHGVPVMIGPIEIAGPFTRATLPNAPVAGGFLTLTNTGAEDDTLVAARSSIARETQIHEMAMQGDVMRMRQLADGLVIPAGATVTLEPGGLHLMFMGLNQSLAEGETVQVTLTFAKAGEITIDLAVAGTAAGAPSGHEGH